ncbi:MAG: VanZ family protein, partial [Lachnospiraceae bacterium]
GISMAVSRQGVKIWDELTDAHMTPGMMEEKAVHLEHPIRKMAHFMEYAVMGILVYNILNCYVGKAKKRYFLAVVWVCLSAALDEFHQYFVPGRWASLLDVLLDTCGGAVGALLCGTILYLMKKKSRKTSEA